MDLDSFSVDTWKGKAKADLDETLLKARVGHYIGAWMDLNKLARRGVMAALKENCLEQADLIIEKLKKRYKHLG